MTIVGLITGVAGQDGSYLAELLLSKGYDVFGVIRRTSSPNTSKLKSVLESSRFFMRQADMCDSTSIQHVLSEITAYDRIEIYNLAAQSYVHTSFSQPEYTADVDAIGVLRILEAVRFLNIVTKTRIYQASTSELFGKVVEIPQTELTPFYPRSPYGVAKLYAYWIIKNYRESYGMFACNGILFNHESERRGEEFITRKISKGVVRTLVDKEFVLELGNLDAKRDWGYAPEFVEGMWRMLQQDTPKDYILATGELHSVREFVIEGFLCVGISIVWRGTGIDEKGYDSSTNRLLVSINPIFYRPCEVECLLGDATLAHTELGWRPCVTFQDIVKRMVDNDRPN